MGVLLCVLLMENGYLNVLKRLYGDVVILGSRMLSPC